MASTLFLNGIFNIVDPVLQLPLYMWSWVALIIVTIAAYAIMYYRGWKPYAPLHGIYYALKNGSTVAFIFDSNLVGELVAERDAKCIFNYADDEYEIDVPQIPVIGGLVAWWTVKMFYYPTKYLKDIDPIHAAVYKIAKVNKDVEIARLLEGGIWERSASVVCGGVPVDIVIDMDNWTIKTSRQHKAIVRAATMWNENYPHDQIHSYRKFLEYILQKKLPKPEEINITTIVPWQRIDAAFPLDLDENEWAGKKRQMAADMEEKETSGYNRLAIWIIIGGLGFAGLILVFRLVTFWMSLPPK